MYMRGKGFSREEVAEAIQHCAPEAHAGQENRNWQRYAERTASYAFSLPGDIWLAKRAKLRQQEQQKREEKVRQDEVTQEAPKLRMR